MNRKHAAAVLATAAALGTSFALAGSADATVSTHSAAKYAVLNCANKPVTRPANWTPFCADYGIYFKNTHWTSWTSHSASGYGTIEENDNYPNHAKGKIYRVAGLVTLWGSAAIKGHPGVDTYTKMTLIFPGQRPAVYKKVNGKWTASYPVTQTLGF